MNKDEHPLTDAPLAGGRTTRGVVRIGNTVRRPATIQSAFVREALLFLENEHFEYAPRHLGSDEYGRDVLGYIEGSVPADLGTTTDEQLYAFLKIVRAFHDLSVKFTGVESHVLCHDDLSPCNVVFREGRPVGIIDWDGLHPGERWQDLTYVVWLWINLGSHSRRVDAIAVMKNALAAYGCDDETKTDFAGKLIDRMHRVLSETDPNREHYQRVCEWVQESLEWVRVHETDIHYQIG